MNPVMIARRYLGTPFRHQGRLPGVGIDCVGVFICLARQLGWVSANFDITGYKRVPDGYSLMHHLHEHFDEIERIEMQPGDFVCVAFDKHPHHVGVIGDYVHGGLSMIHASTRSNSVVEHRLVFNDEMRFVAAFRKGEV